MIVLSRKFTLCGVVALMVGSAVALMAQAKSDGADVGSLAALTAEIRQLRLALEESTRSQAQTQALGVYLSAQQSRLVQVAARLDVARRELDAATVRYKAITAELSSVADSLVREANPETRAALEQKSRALKLELESIALQDQLARSQEAELSQMMQAENARWTDLISRLERLINK
jgi:parvulin-like peptidyl-prolyl isomerase